MELIVLLESYDQIFISFLLLIDLDAVFSGLYCITVLVKLIFSNHSLSILADIFSTKFCTKQFLKHTNVYQYIDLPQGNFGMLASKNSTKQIVIKLTFTFSLSINGNCFVLLQNNQYIRKKEIKQKNKLQIRNESKQNSIKNK